MKTELNIETWARKDHFNLFNKFTEPQLGICTHIDCTNAYRTAKERGISFYLYYLYQSLKAANEIEEFRYRIENGKVFCYDIVHAAPTVDRQDGTFGFSILEYKPTLEEFIHFASIETERVRNSKGLDLSKERDDVIHYSVLPWIQFTSVSHPRTFGINDSVPKITFGKMFEENGRRKMPVDIHANHALMDGLHVAKYLELFQKLMNQ
jgi:chloramphenicol O-acetyltransferase type A